MTILLVVTGASRGLGQAIATAFVRNETQKISRIRALLLARSDQGLLLTESLMKSAAKQSGVSLDVSLHSIDLADLNTLEENLDKILRTIPTSQGADETEMKFSSYVLVNNAGSLGHLGLSADTRSLKDLQKEIELNITSAVWVTSQFVKRFSAPHSVVRSETSNIGESSSCTVVNVSSLCAIEPFPTMGMYCTGKAARDMFHQVLAKEATGVKVLNYAPGACETEMTDDLRCAKNLDKALLQYYTKAHEDGSLICPDDTSNRLVSLILSGDFESGKHIDYWDLESPKVAKS